MKKLSFIILCFIMFSCKTSKKTEYWYYEGPIQGTTFHIKYEWNEDLANDIDSLLQTFNKYLSNYDTTSVISKINNNLDYEINNLVTRMISASFEIYNKTNGAFDITIAPLANLWGFGWINKEEKSIPDSLIVDSILQYVGMDKIILKDNMIVKSNPDIKIIGNAIAQGLSADYVSEYFLELGLDNFLVEIGGEIYCHGLNPNGKIWSIGIDKPVEDSKYEDRENQLMVGLSNKGIATSGNYRKFFREKDQKYGHSIDPRTGYPAENSLLSVSVISNSAMESDGYATAFMVMGLKESLIIAEELNELEAYFIYEDENGDERVIYTSGFDNYILYK